MKAENKSSKIESEVVHLRTVLLAVALTAIGVVLLVCSVQDWAATPDGRANPWSSLLSQIGGVLVATGVLTIAWEFIARRAFAREVFAKAQLGSEVVSSGLIRVPDRYHAMDWDALFKGAQELDVVVAYARTWRNSQAEHLRALAKRGVLRVYLPDPDDPATLEVFAIRFSRDVKRMESDLREAITEYQALGPNVEVYVRKGDLVFTCYRFGRKSVITLYSHTRERQSLVPTFVVEGGDLGAFVDREIETIHSQSRLVSANS
jgi:hypothetical protein